MIRTLIQYLPTLDVLKEQLRKDPERIHVYFNAEILRGDIESTEYVLKLKEEYYNKNDKSN
jgi:hypothetical protein